MKDKSEDIIKYLIFDTLVINGFNLMSLTFENRLKVVKKEIIKKLRTKDYLEMTKDKTQEYEDEDDNEYNIGIDHLGEEETENIRVYLKDFFLDIHTKVVNQIITNK